MFWNQLKTTFLLAGLSGLLLAMGALFGGQQGAQVAFVMALIMNFIMYFFSDKIVLNMYRAQPLDAQRYSWVYAQVQELAHAMKIPMPKLWLIPQSMANAFATGRNPHHASVALTTGILSLLDQAEMRGVLAHELSHIKNRDILVSTIAATLATAIGYLANMLQHVALWSAVNNDRRRNNNNPITMIIAAILMPFAATLIQLAISRSREYLADQTGAQTSKEPLALASALQKLHANIQTSHLQEKDLSKASTASLFIVHPFCSKGILDLFSTHPPAAKRIERLQKMAHKLF